MEILLQQHQPEADQSEERRTEDAPAHRQPGAAVGEERVEADHDDPAHLAAVKPEAS